MNMIFVMVSILLLSVLNGTDKVDQSDSKTTVQTRKIVNPLSARSLYLNLVVGNQVLGMATGFVVEWNNQPYLITNRHVVSGRNEQTNSYLFPNDAVPDKIIITHHGQSLGTWVKRVEPLFDTKGNPRWIEHPSGHQVDVIALPLQVINNEVKLYPFNLSLADADIVPEPAMPVSIIGFPLGMTSVGAFPIWKTGHIASDPDLGYGGHPAFLIDATTRSGMSGSPVLLCLYGGGFATRSGNRIMAQSGPAILFLGIYSGRLGSESEIGIVWRPSVITDILSQIKS